VSLAITHHTRYRFDRRVRIGARFTPYGHSPGPVDTSAWQRGAMDLAGGAHPRPLDLRRVPAPR
jgi:hypothetical protein